jgi:iron(III) transport system substrate-binding protein
VAQARSSRAVSHVGVVLVGLLLLTACGPAEEVVEESDAPPVETTDEAPDELSGTLRIYTSVTEDTVDAVTQSFQEAHPGVDLEVFRAPTGELNARIAAEKRDEGRMLADLLWLTDPLSIAQFDDEGDLAEWTPDNVDVVPEAFREDRFWGTRLLNMVLVHHEDVEPPPTSWHDLTDPAYSDGVAVPDPEFAGSAFGVLGYFALSDEFGWSYYEDLADNGAVQVSAPGDVVTGVAEGRFQAGMTLDKVAFDARDEGSPIEVVFPDPGAIAMHSPIAVVETTEARELAEAFVEFVLTEDAQEAIADTGWEPVRDDVTWDRTGATVTVDWDAAFDRQDELLEQYRAIFGG